MRESVACVTTNVIKKLKDLSLCSNAVLHLTKRWQIVLRYSPSFNHQMEPLDYTGLISFLEGVFFVPCYSNNYN